MSNFVASGFVLILGVALPLLSASQAGSALSGRVADGSAPVAGAIVTISSPGFLKSVTTDADGRFVLEPVPPGRYEFRTSARGYAVFERSVMVHCDDFRRNWIDVRNLIPAGRQTVNVLDLAAGKQARNRSRRATAARTGV